MKTVSVIGHYAVGLDYLDGQTIKTKIITSELCRALGEKNVVQFDTHGGVKTLIKAPLFVFKSLQKAKNVVILPAHNGLRIFGRLLPFFRAFFKNRKIHYVVIGGWLPKLLETKNSLAKALRKFDGIFVETNTMKIALEDQGFKNVFVMPNCKALTPLSYQELVYQNEAPYKLCTFSRVMKEKGIEDAIEVVKEINEKRGKIIYTLDIYGQIDPEQKEWFDSLQSRFPAYVNYGGLVPFDKSVEILKNYFALLFPTRFYTEGIPGTIIDAYAAGVPVISAKWQSFADIIADKVTGVGYEFGSIVDLKNMLIDIEKSTERFNSLRQNCLNKSKEYLPSQAVQILIKELD